MYKIIRVVKFLKPSWTFLVIVSTVAVLCAGCKLDYKDADLAEEMNAQVPNSVLEDFSQVVLDRSTRYYEDILKWSRIFLKNKSFTTFSGNTVARAILFPMEKIFELEKS